MVGTVATVPSVKRAVHHLTAPRHGTRPVHRVATAAVHPAAESARAVDCGPAAGPLPAVPLVTYAAPIPDEPGAGSGVAPIGGAPVGAVAAVQAPVAFGPVATATPTPTPTAPVPEPATWALMILGAGSVGIALRRWRQHGRAGHRARLAGGTALSGIGTAAEAGDMAATSVAAKTTMAGAAGKAMLCACPAALVAGSVVGVPPVRHAVHTATAPAPVRAASLPIRSIVPCSQPMPVPVSAAAVPGFPDSVTTLPARPA